MVDQIYCSIVYIIWMVVPKHVVEPHLYRGRVDQRLHRYVVSSRQCQCAMLGTTHTSAPYHIFEFEKFHLRSIIPTEDYFKVSMWEFRKSMAVPSLSDGFLNILFAQPAQPWQQQSCFIGLVTNHIHCSVGVEIR